MSNNGQKVAEIPNDEEGRTFQFVGDPMNERRTTFVPERNVQVADQAFDASVAYYCDRIVRLQADVASYEDENRRLQSRILVFKSEEQRMLGHMQTWRKKCAELTKNNGELQRKYDDLRGRFRAVLDDLRKLPSIADKSNTKKEIKINIDANVLDRFKANMKETLEKESAGGVTIDFGALAARNTETGGV